MAAESITSTALHATTAAMPAHASSMHAADSYSAGTRLRVASVATPLFWLMLCTFAVRIVGIDRPLVSTFATRNVVHAMVARNWAEGRAPLWRPTIDCLADGERAWHLMEWPAPAYAAGLCWKLFGGSLDAWGRGISIVASLLAVFLVYRIAERSFGARAAQAAAFVLAFSPVSMIYGQSFLLESSLVALLLATIYLFDRWLNENHTGLLIAAAIACGFAVLSKVYMLLTLVPLVAMFLRHAYATRKVSTSSRNRRTVLRAATAAFGFGIAFVPVAAWYFWVFSLSHTSGPAAEYHPLTRSAIHGFPHPLLLSTAYYARLGIDFFTVVLTPLGVLLAIFGITDSRIRPHLPLVAVFCSLPILFPLKFMVANYYYVVLLPALAIAVGLGWQRWCERRRPSKRTTQMLVGCTLLIALRFTIGPAFRTPAEDRSVTVAAAAMQGATQPEEPIATMHGSTLDLLYYCNRPGWALDVADVRLAEKLAAARGGGALKFVVVGMESVECNPATSELLASLPVEQSGDDWRLYSLESLPKR